MSVDSLKKLKIPIIDGISGNTPRIIDSISYSLAEVERAPKEASLLCQLGLRIQTLTAAHFTLVKHLHQYISMLQTTLFFLKLFSGTSHIRPQSWGWVRLD